MKSSIIAVVLSLSIGAVGSLSFAEDHLVRFEGGIGVTPVSSVAVPVNDGGTFQNVNRNDVCGVAPADSPGLSRD